MRIKEVIVVEGHHDSATLKQYFDVDTIETNGSAINKTTLAYINEIQNKRGIIIFTDPDFAGERIRKIINKHIDGCKNAFISQEKASTSKKIGVEHASKEALEEALQNVVSFNAKQEKSFEKADLVALGLDGAANATIRREMIGSKLKFGKCNAKTFLNRLNLMGVSKEELVSICEELKVDE